MLLGASLRTVSRAKPQSPNKGVFRAIERPGRLGILDVDHMLVNINFFFFGTLGPWKAVGSVGRDLEAFGGLLDLSNSMGTFPMLACRRRMPPEKA